MGRTYTGDTCVLCVLCLLCVVVYFPHGNAYTWTKSLREQKQKQKRRCKKHAHTDRNTCNTLTWFVVQKKKIIKKETVGSGKV
jgi:hypothetical protein